MGVYLLAALCAVITIISLVLALKALISKAWFVQWLRGTAGIFALGSAIVGVLLIVNLVQYHTVKEGQVIATLSFVQIDDQEFEVELTDNANNRRIVRLSGDQWQLDVRLIKFSNWFDGDLPAYKLDRISGRYLSLEQQNSSDSKAYDLADMLLVDTWGWMTRQKWLGFVQMKFGSATYMPMADGAIYQVRLLHDGLDALAVNTQAKDALSSWQ